MSVYTEVSTIRLKQFLEMFSIGELISHEGIGAGIENTNYAVTTTQGQFILTLFEQMSAEDASYYLDLMAYLADRSLPCARPIENNRGQRLHELCQRPAALVQKLDGHHIERPSADHCRQIGIAMAKMHLAAMDYPHPKHNTRGREWWTHTLSQLQPVLDNDVLKCIRQEIQYQQEQVHTDMPMGMIHADLFRDNALFDHDHLSGIIDLYYACHDYLLYDIAVTANDWCTDKHGQLEAGRTQALLHGYQSIRPITEEEWQSWPAMLRAAALRFWLSRLQDMHFPREGHLTHIKDPGYFETILKQHQKQALPHSLSNT
ncbi:MAG: homoserine kinase [Gammaproteobacteria bacterium]|nr:MAG: homoserine kinase [Gammaproteobacteria bacterium]